MQYCEKIRSERPASQDLDRKITQAKDRLDKAKQSLKNTSDVHSPEYKRALAEVRKAEGDYNRLTNEHQKLFTKEGFFKPQQAVRGDSEFGRQLAIEDWNSNGKKYAMDDPKLKNVKRAVITTSDGKKINGWQFMDRYTKQLYFTTDGNYSNSSGEAALRTLYRVDQETAYAYSGRGANSSLLFKSHAMTSPDSSLRGSPLITKEAGYTWTASGQGKAEGGSYSRTLVSSQDGGRWLLTNDSERLKPSSWQYFPKDSSPTLRSGATYFAQDPTSGNFIYRLGNQRFEQSRVNFYNAISRDDILVLDPVTRTARPLSSK